MRQLKGKRRFGSDIILLQDSTDILGVEADPFLRFDHHLLKLEHKAFQKVSLLWRMRNLIDSSGMMTVYKVQVRPVTEYAPFT